MPSSGRKGSTVELLFSDRPEILSEEVLSRGCLLWGVYLQGIMKDMVSERVVLK